MVVSPSPWMAPWAGHPPLWPALTTKQPEREQCHMASLYYRIGMTRMSLRTQNVTGRAMINFICVHFLMVCSANHFWSTICPILL